MKTCAKCSRVIPPRQPGKAGRPPKFCDVCRATPPTRCPGCCEVRSSNDYYRRSSGEVITPCKICQRERTARYNDANRSEVNRKQKVRAQERRKENPEHERRKSRKASRTSRYGLADSVALEMRAMPCFLCGLPPGANKKAHHIDHCHATGAVRGVLCARHNTMLAAIEEYRRNPELFDHYLTRGADYRAVDREA